MYLPTLQQIQFNFSLDFHFMNPLVTSGAYLELNTLQHRCWIEVSSIDLWLLDMWRSMPQPHFQYLPTFFIPPMAQAEVTQDEILHFRSFFPLLPPAGTSCPYQNLVYVLNTGGDRAKSGNHFCTLAFIPSSKLIYIIGRKYSMNHANYDDKDWDSWDGRRIWRRVCALFGWDTVSIPLSPIRLCSVNWVQNGYDCGPIACQISQHLMQNGLCLDRDIHWKRPKLPCCHPLRKKVAERVNHLIWDGIRAFDLLSAEQIQEIDSTLANTWADLMITLKAAFDLDPASELKIVIQNLDKAMQNCPHCHAMLEEMEHDRAALICPIPTRKKALQEATESRKKELLKGTKSMAALVMGEEPTPDSQDLEEDPTEEEEAVPDRPGRNNIFQVGDWTQARIGRFPRPKTGPHIPIPTSLRGRQLPFDAHFDNYYSGPTLTDLHPIPSSIMGYDTSLVYLADRITTFPWSLFKDYGYRLLPNFAKNFYLGKPFLFKEHLCPVGLPNPPDSIMAYHAPRFSRDGAMVDIKDSLHINAAELLELADAEHDDAVLLTGKTLEGDYILLDLQRDAVQPQNLLYSCDIDSMIWITRTPKFIGPFGIYASPVIRDRAPIWKSNHAYVELLFPQSDEDREEGGMREEWWTKSFPLSRIPHLLFGLLNQGIPVEILLFFPRMTHRHPLTHFSDTLIPKHIQNILWDRVILPSIRLILPETAAVYFPLDREHLRFKQGLGKAGASRAPLHALQGFHMTEVVKEMKKSVRRAHLCCCNANFRYLKIREGGDSLAHFGSFFFVVQIKGSKRLTHSQEETLDISAKEAFNNFQRSFPGLDWNYMNLPKNGQLLCDAGITIQPDNPEEELVGLWRLDSLEASYGAGGYLMGQIHTLNTLSMYGGMQAESPSWRSKETHIRFRSSYNLAYEATRQHDNSCDLFQEKEVFNRGPWFQHQINSVKEIYEEKACLQSYGVRDEFRISGLAINELIQCVHDSVRLFL
jgi:hypothetical protein